MSVSDGTQHLNQHAKVDAKHIERLIHTVGRFRPKSCTQIQFYNFVREFCIIHCCSLQEAIARCRVEWPKCNANQQTLYMSERLALLPIPVPINIVFEALRDERDGLLSLAKGDGLRYTVQAFNPIQLKKKSNKKSKKRFQTFSNPSKEFTNFDLNYFTGNKPVQKKHKKRHTTKKKKLNQNTKLNVRKSFDLNTAIKPCIRQGQRSTFHSATPKLKTYSSRGVRRNSYITNQNYKVANTKNKFQNKIPTNAKTISLQRNQKEYKKIKTKGNDSWRKQPILSKLKRIQSVLKLPKRKGAMPRRVNVMRFA